MVSHTFWTYDIVFLLAAIDPRTGGHYVCNLHYYLQGYVVFAIWIAVGFRDDMEAVD
jgi:hypothetical protein